MELKKAFEITLNYFNKEMPIKINKDGYICLNDMSNFFPSKRLDHWIENKDTIKFIEVVEKDLNTPLSGYYQKSTNETKKCIITQRGRGGGTYAHKYIAFEYAMWLSPEFKLNVIKSYENGTQRKSDWNIKRILASENYKLLAEAIKDSHDPAMFFHYSNEADMLNNIIFGKTHKEIGYNPRDKATEIELDYISYMESRNASFIEIGLDYEERKELLIKLFGKYKNKKEIEDKII
jgi:hypothetical protein